MDDSHLPLKNSFLTSRPEEGLIIKITPAIEPLSARPFLSVDKRCRVFQSVAPGTERLCLLVANCPSMGLVAVKTLEPRLCHMQIMLSNLCFVTVTTLQAVLA